MASVGFVSPISDRFHGIESGIMTESLVLHGKENLLLEPQEFSETELAKLTNNYEGASFIGNTQFGKLYRSTTKSDVGGTQDVVVKIWDEEQIYLYLGAMVDYDIMFPEEILFLKDPLAKSHPNLVKLIGYCPGDVKGVVYDLNPIDTLHNLTDKDRFTWLLRMKTLLGFARLLECLHCPPKPYLLMNIDAAHIVLDQEWNPILLDFSLMSGGILGVQGKYKTKVPMSRGYIDTELAPEGYRWDETYHDVFAFGVLLLGVISKRMVEKEVIAVSELIDEWAVKEYRNGCSLVDKSLAEEPFYYESDGPTITALGMQCIGAAENRPSMKEVVQRIGSLLVVQRHANML